MKTTSMKTLSILFLIIAVSIMIASGTAIAATPARLNYHGSVTVNDKAYTGTGYFKFAIINNATAPTINYWVNNGLSTTAGGQPTKAVSLQVYNGIYNVILGDPTIKNMTAIPKTVFQNSDTAFLRVWFSHTGIGFEHIKPDTQLVAVPYSYHADHADTANTVSGLSAPPSSSGAVVGTQTNQTVINKTITANNSIDAGAIKTGNLNPARMPLGGNWNLTSNMDIADGHIYIDLPTQAGYMGSIGINTKMPMATLDISEAHDQASPSLMFTRFRGSPTEKKPVKKGDVIGDIAFAGMPVMPSAPGAPPIPPMAYAVSSFIRSKATENWSMVPPNMDWSSDLTFHTSGIGYSGTPPTLGPVTEPRMTITGNGLVGIGTTDPYSDLCVANYQPGMAFPHFALINGDRVFSNPIGAGTALGRMSFYGEISPGQLGLGAAILAEATSTWTATNNNANLYFMTGTVNSTVPDMTITGGGFVGIGTKNPSDKLSIASPNTATSLLLSGANGYTGLKLENYSSQKWYIGLDGQQNNNDLIVRRNNSSNAITVSNSLGNVEIANSLYVKKNLKTDGKAGIGVTPSTANLVSLRVDGAIQFKPRVTATTPWSELEDGSKEPVIYAIGGSLYAGNGNSVGTKISPHDPETGEWIFYSKNFKTGRTVRINMEKLVRKFEEISGEQFLFESFAEDNEL